MIQNLITLLKSLTRKFVTVQTMILEGHYVRVTVLTEKLGIF
jgi:hypothetical protein